MNRFLNTLAVAFLTATIASAEAIVITFENAAQSGTPGSTLAFNAELENTSSETVYLNSADLNLGGSSFTINFIDAFFANVPVFLDPGQSTSLIELFTIGIGDPFTDPLDTYAGTYTLVGGADSGAQDVLTSASFSVKVTGAENPPVAVPEPSAVASLVTELGVVACAIAFLRRRRLT